MNQDDAHTSTTLVGASDGVITLDAEDLIDSLNPVAERIFGFSTEELHGSSVGVLLPEPYRSQYDNCIYEDMLADEVIEGVPRDRYTLPLKLSFNDLRYSEGRMLIAIVRDLARERVLDKWLRCAERMKESLR